MTRPVPRLDVFPWMERALKFFPGALGAESTEMAVMSAICAPAAAEICYRAICASHAPHEKTRRRRA